MEQCQNLSVNDLDSYYCDYCLAQYSDQDTSTVGDEPLNISTIELQEIEHLETEFATKADDRAAFSNEVDSDVVELIILSDAKSTNGETTTLQSNEIEILIVISDENTEQIDSENMTTNSNRERSVLAPPSQPQKKRKKKKKQSRESSLSTVSNFQN